MWKIVLVMIAGIITGMALRKIKFISHISKTISLTIYLMLFLLGLSIGGNPEIISNLSTLGLQALFLSLAGIIGSLLAGKLLWIWLFRDETGLKADKEADEEPADHGPMRNKWRMRWKKYSDSIIVVIFFIAGVVLGYTDVLGAEFIGDGAVMIVLYILIAQAGISLGHDMGLKRAIKGMKPKVLLVPLATAVGTLSMAAIVGLILTKWSVTDCLAASSGFAYYSLSSVLIAEYAVPSLGEQMATELATIALLVNVIREIICLLMTPVFVKWFGKIAPICVAGVTAVDVCLPVLVKNCGKEYLPVIIISGMITDFSVPFLVPLFCSL